MPFPLRHLIASLTLIACTAAAPNPTAPQINSPVLRRDGC